MASVPIFRYSSRCTTTDAQTVRPYRSRIALLETGTLWLDTSRAPLQRATGFIRRLVRFAERIFHSKMQFGVEVSVLACASKKKKGTFATSSAVTYRQTDKNSYHVRKKERNPRYIGCG